MMVNVYHFGKSDNLNLALHFIAKSVTGGLKRAILELRVLVFQRKHKIAKGKRKHKTSKTAKLWFLSQQ